MKWWLKRNKDTQETDMLQTKILDILKEKPYSLKYLLIDKQHFGNTIVIIARDNMLLRFVKDRDFTRSELGFSEIEDQWLDFECLLKVLRVRIEDFSHDLLEVINAAIHLENEHHDKLEGLQNKEVFDNIKKEIFLFQRNNSPFWKHIN